MRITQHNVEGNGANLYSESITRRLQHAKTEDFNDYVTAKWPELLDIARLKLLQVIITQDDDSELKKHAQVHLFIQNMT